MTSKEKIKLIINEINSSQIFSLLSTEKKYYLSNFSFMLVVISRKRRESCKNNRQWIRIILDLENLRSNFIKIVILVTQAFFLEKYLILKFSITPLLGNVELTVNLFQA